ncbi:hypothetical protein LZ24_00936 [Desulfobotulus alkaliphilus]|uniref:Uncharacterized protein n=1 Tax=Desulfobotulus alkaliphilus TaxID=622671 RepID=A0A562RZI9_9BACT|nr:hypothetical protein [Desulfobotulus alkaliphilus]TWI74333.1 hypothetical protein LZ24_00936 [Desulfobotulus alkaliphilus]
MEEKMQAIAESLVAYATQSNDILPLVEALPEESSIAGPTMEYEIRMLKILSVGWGLAFLLAEHPAKTTLSELFWQRISLLSKEIDEICKSSGTEIDYFSALRKRLDMYVGALSRASNPEDPGREVGACYAGLCGDPEDSYALVAGRRVFTGVLSSLQNYLKENMDS